MEVMTRLSFADEKTEPALLQVSVVLASLYSA